MHKVLRVAIGVLTAFIALTAIGGGIAMLTGLDQFPPEWLAGTPFSNYTIPALLLAIVVGGSSLAAAVMAFGGIKGNALVAVVAGAMLVGYIAVEVIILKQTPPGPTPIEIFYFVMGLLVLAPAVYLWRLPPDKV